MKIILSFILVLFLISGCTEQKIPTINDLTNDVYVSFVFRSTDSTRVTFLFDPDKKDILCPVSFKSTGLSGREIPLSVSVVEKQSTAAAGLFELPEELIFRNDTNMYTAYVRLKYDPILDDREVTLVLELNGTDDYLLGESNRRSTKIVFSNILTQPSWWTSLVSIYTLGNYSDEKYLCLIKVVQKDLTGVSENELQDYAQQFLAYLIEQKNAGTPVYEKDGSLMTMPGFW